MTFAAPVLPRNRQVRQAKIRQIVEALPQASVMAERIEAILAQATDAERLDGAQWYKVAGEIGATVGEIAKISPSHGAGIVAALSPQCSWDENIVRAIGFAGGEHVGATNDGLGKSRAIAAGQHPLTVLGGRKVRSFFHNITGHKGHVTIDRHAVAIVWGRPLSDREIKILERVGAYTYIASVYRAVARRNGLDAPTLQAITWLAWRRIKHIDYTVEAF